MVKYRRTLAPGGTFFITITIADRASALLVDQVQILRHAFAFARNAKPFVIDAIVVLPERLHMLITLPEGDAAFSDRVRRIKARFTQGVHWASVKAPRLRENGSEVWQARFWEHTIRDSDDYTRHVDYIHYNPVKHGHVTSAEAWPYSSLHRFIRHGILHPDGAPMLHPKRVNMVNQRSPQ